VTRKRPDDLPGLVLDADEVRDRPERWQVTESHSSFESGRVISVRTDQVAPAEGDSFTRDVVEHPGAVGIIALDHDDRLLLVSQYRHPVGHRLLEPPAGLLDVHGEDPAAAAARELAEEGHIRAGEWRLLVDAFTSPGMTDETIRIYLARGLQPIAEDDWFVGVHEEADMPLFWAPLQDVVEAVLAGVVHNPILVMGALSCWSALHGPGYDALRAVRPG
jgi:ADP-ribose pyrophosphatase